MKETALFYTSRRGCSRTKKHTQAPKRHHCAYVQLHIQTLEKEQEMAEQKIRYTYKATKKSERENANVSADANAPINFKDEAEGNSNTRRESNILKQAFENMKQKLKS